MGYAVKGVVKGRVQGVGFRVFVKQKAQEHNLTGWAKNLPDGNVEVVLQGVRSDVNEVQHEVSMGPATSDVRSLSWTMQENLELQGFNIE